MSEVLTRGGKDTSMPWENPQTGARGTITPLASAYSQDGVTCRDFLASYVKNGTESWLQGEACRAERGKWEVRSCGRGRRRGERVEARASSLILIRHSLFDFAYTRTAVMMPFGKMSSGLAWRCAMPCSWV